MDRLAVIDLGSNTFHLIIVEKTETAPFFKEVYRERQFIYIASEGLENISFLKINDAVICLQNFAAKCRMYDCEHIVAVATEALRAAGNGEEVLRKLEKALGQSIELIEGRREAELIYKGTMCMDRKWKGQHLIMDIGGGSVEFVLFDEEGVKYAQSFQAGLSVIKNRYKLSEPPSKKELSKLKIELDNVFKELNEALADFEFNTLVGSSGSFEILESVKDDTPSPKGNSYRRKEFEKICRHILSSDLEQRARIPGMPIQRAALSKESFSLIKYIMDKYPAIQNIIVSPYALKEGVIFEKFKEV